MNNNKTLNRILIGVVIVLYGYLFLSWNDKPEDMDLDGLSVESSTYSSIQYVFPDHWKDPFRSYKKKVKKAVVKQVPLPKKKVFKRRIIQLPKFEVKARTQLEENYQISLFYQNDLHFVKEKDIWKDMMFEKITDDSLFVLYKDSLFKIGYSF